ncbi:MAG: carbohydrate porin [Planctomycetota bacterium]|nr:carbohydrate porin [Planctomycetota bacterium]
MSWHWKLRAAGRALLAAGTLVLTLGAPDQAAGQEICFSCAVCAGQCDCCCSCFDDLCTRETFTDGFWGLQPAMAECGIAYDAFATQFYQGVASGGQERVFEYGGKIDQFFVFDGDKLCGHKGFSVAMHAESRFGQDINNDAAGLAPANAAMLYPLENEHDTAITGFLVNQALSEELVVSAGKYNLFDLFNQIYPQTGRGVTGFMNVSSFIPLTAARGLGLSVNGASIMRLQEGQVQGALAVFDTNNSSTTSGVSELFDNGMTLIAYGRHFTEWNCLPGSHALLGIYSSGSYTSLDPLDWAFIPDVGLVASEETGTWNLTYFFEQKLWVDPEVATRNIGILSAWAISDGNPNPIGWFGNVALQGQGFNSCRPLDSVGTAFFYTGLSSDLKQLASPVMNLEDLYGVELYYSAAVTPWFFLTGDVQVINPADASEDAALVLGVRGMVHL